MNTKLFDIRTTIKAQFRQVDVDSRILVEVKIIASKAVRSRIWNIIVKDYFNPGVAQYGFKDDTPTSLTLVPYPGYEHSDLVAQMAEAAACFALVEDFTVLLHQNVFNVFDEGQTPWPDFAIDGKTIAELQRHYAGYMAVKDLQNRVHDLSFKGINYNAVREWHNEAVEAFRRLQFASVNPGNEKTRSAQLDIAVKNLSRIENIESEARALHETQASIKRQLEAAIAVFTAAAEASGATSRLRDSYHQIGFRLRIEQTRLDTDVDGFAQSWEDVRWLIEEIRKVTPPSPLTAKK